MRNVIFRSLNRWGSSINRGEDISEHLQSLGYKSKYWDGEILINEIGMNRLPDGIKDSIVVFLKEIPDDGIEQLKKNNNLLILDVIDCIANNNYTIKQLCYMINKQKWVLDGLIVPTEDLKNTIKLLCPKLEIEVLYHHWDKKHLQNIEYYCNNEYEFKLAYIGSPAGHFHKEQVENLTAVYDWEKMTTTSPLYTCHYSVRPKDDLQFLYKPNTKSSVASAVGANAIHTRDNSLIDILPYDYPYYTEPDLKSVQEKSKYAEDTFDSPIWHEGLDMMRSLKERTSIERIAGFDYVNFFRRF